MTGHYERLALVIALALGLVLSIADCSNPAPMCELNACGGCKLLVHKPGTPCGSVCGTFVCDGADSVVCGEATNVLKNSDFEVGTTCTAFHIPGWDISTSPNWPTALARTPAIVDDGACGVLGMGCGDRLGEYASGHCVSASLGGASTGEWLELSQSYIAPGMISGLAVTYTRSAMWTYNTDWQYEVFYEIDGVRTLVERASRRFVLPNIVTSGRLAPAASGTRLKVILHVEKIGPGDLSGRITWDDFRVDVCWAPPDQRSSYCGNAVLERGEECDLGGASNTGEYGGCNADCTLAPRCGDSVVNGPEVCDDGNNAGCAGACSVDCTKLITGCGDGLVCGDEECDDGNNFDGDLCRPDCASWLWTRVEDFSRGGFDDGYGVSVDRQGNIVVAGVTQMSGSSVGWVSKYNSDGQQLWSDPGPGPAFVVAADHDDSFVVAGAIYDSDNDSHLWLRKYSAFGEHAWTVEIDSPDATAEDPYSLAVDSQDNILILVQAADGRGWFGKWDTNGRNLWPPVRLNEVSDMILNGTAIAIGPSDEFVVVGNVLLGSGRPEIFVEKFNSAGAKEWRDYYYCGFDKQDWQQTASDVAVDGAGNIVVVGSVPIPLSDFRLPNFVDMMAFAWLRKYGPDGNVLWSVVHDYIFSFANAVALGADYSIFVTGWTEFNAVWTAKFGSDGRHVWSRKMTGPHPFALVGWDVAIAPDGNPVIVGQFPETDNDFDIFVRKYFQ